MGWTKLKVKSEIGAVPQVWRKKKEIRGYLEETRKANLAVTKKKESEENPFQVHLVIEKQK